uniref:Reverse transcriptase domain-containing protein n=1 Tax=Angiostrongylus cantonensis TaxID=6313 RepID=A0A0K0DAY1_ANGCA
MKAESTEVTKRRMSPETLELIRQREIVRAAGNRELTSELAKQCRQAIREDPKERRAAVMIEAAEAGKCTRKSRLNFANYKTKMIALRRSDGTITASRKAMEKIIHEYYSDLFDSHVHLPSYEIKEDGYGVPPVVPSEIRHAISSVKNRTAPGPERIRSEHLKNLPPVHVSTLARLKTRYLSECKIPTNWTTSKIMLLFKKIDQHDIGNYRPICLLSVVCKLFTRVILNSIYRTLDQGQPCEQAGFRKGCSTMDHIHTMRLIGVLREYKRPLCLTFINLQEAFYSIEIEAVMEAFGSQGVPAQYVKILRELFRNFTTKISPFYNDINVDVMRTLEWNNMGVKIDGRQIHHLRFAGDVVLVTPGISQAERMLANFDEACGKIGLRLNLKKTMFMKNGLVCLPHSRSTERISPNAPFMTI